jgi:hypothetical protein
MTRATPTLSSKMQIDPAVPTYPSVTGIGGNLRSIGSSPMKDGEIQAFEQQTWGSVRA